MPDQHVRGGKIAVYKAAIVQRGYSFPNLPHQGRDTCVGEHRVRNSIEAASSRTPAPL